MCYMGRFGSVDFDEVVDVCSRQYHFDVMEVAAAAESCSDLCFRRSYFKNEDVRISQNGSKSLFSLSLLFVFQVV